MKLDMSIMSLWGQLTIILLNSLPSIIRTWRSCEFHHNGNRVEWLWN